MDHTGGLAGRRGGSYPTPRRVWSKLHVEARLRYNGEMPELTSNVAVVDRLVELVGRDVLDVGCGRGGARARSWPPAARARSGWRPPSDSSAMPGVTASGAIVVGRAEELPLPEHSLDAVLFMRSLHHVPEAAMLPALADARRVLRPGGVVYVAEPLAEGDYFELVRIVDDETEVRAAAQRAVADCARAGLERVQTLEYEVGAVSTGIGRLRKRIVDVDPERGAVFDAHEGELAAAFARLGDERDGGRWFTQPMRADLLQPAS